MNAGAVWSVVTAVVVLLVIAFVLLYNAMVRLRNRVEEAWSGIDVQLRRRHDLVPNLVEAVQEYARHERDVFERTAEARAEAMRAWGTNPRAEAEAEASLSGALGGLRAVVEDYPELRATENFQRLQRDLTEVEDQIQAARRIYNSNTRIYNTKIQVFPNSIVARMAGFRPREFFEILGEADREPVEVTFRSEA